MSYRIIYGETPPVRGECGWRLDSARSERFADEHEALGRARELLETGEHYGIAVRDDCGNELSGVRLQLKLGFSGQ